MDHSQALETIEWYESERKKTLAENAALKAKLGLVAKAAYPTFSNTIASSRPLILADPIRSILTTEPKVLSCSTRLVCPECGTIYGVASINTYCGSHYNIKTELVKRTVIVLSKGES